MDSTRMKMYVSMKDVDVLYSKFSFKMSLLPMFYLIILNCS